MLRSSLLSEVTFESRAGGALHAEVLGSDFPRLFSRESTCAESPFPWASATELSTIEAMRATIALSAELRRLPAVGETMEMVDANA
jgi:hypothetical protein